mmetsp:Transcript_10110/g.30892  ORF Transcript_10110/g.30892 Transcript_10110/m.30892 type:complete len:162 (-) Transcript_10110:1299-1784(-)
MSSKRTVSKYPAKPCTMLFSGTGNLRQMYLVKLSGFCPSGNKAVRPQEQTGPVGPLRCTHLSLRMFKPEAGLRSCDLHAPVDLDHVRSFKVCSRASKGTNAGVQSVRAQWREKAGAVLGDTDSVFVEQLACPRETFWRQFVVSERAEQLRHDKIRLLWGRK